MKARMLTGVYILQANRAAFNQTNNKICPLCSDGEEDLVHFICLCSTLERFRTPMMGKLMEIFPLVISNHPSNWSAEQKTQLIMDSSHDKVLDLVPNVADFIPQIEKKARLLTFALHRERAKLLDEKSSSTAKPRSQKHTVRTKQRTHL